MNLFPKPITIKPLGDNFIEIHCNISYKTNQKSIFLVILFILLIPLILIPSIFSIQSSSYPLFISLVFLGFLYNISSDHIVLKFNTVHDRFECIFDSDSRNSKMYNTSLSQLDCMLITKTQNLSEEETIPFIKKLTSKALRNIYLQFRFNNEFNFKIGPIIGAKTVDLALLQTELRIFFEKNNYSIKFKDGL